MIEKQNNFILSIDLLGFETWISTSSVDNVLDEYASIITGASYAAKKIGEEEFDFFVYSDTLIIIFHCSTIAENLIKLLKCAHTIQYGQMYRGIVNDKTLRPIRGTITYGEFIYHKGDISTQAFNRPQITAKNVDIFIGKPVIEAYHLEKKIQIMAVILAESAIAKISDGLSKKLLDCGLLIKYRIPMKNREAFDGYVCSPLCDSHFEAVLNKLNNEKAKFKKCKNTLDKYTNTMSLFNYMKDNGFFYPRIRS